MPTRMIRDGFLDSEKVNKLSFLAECFFHRLMLVADDYGRFKASSTWLRSKLFPLKEDYEVSSAQIFEALNGCAAAGLVRLYTKDGIQYGVIPNFGQRLQRKHSIFPEPPQESTEDNGGSPDNPENHGEQNNSTVIHRYSPQTTEDNRESPPEVEEEEKKNKNTPLPPQRGESENCQNQELILESQATPANPSDKAPDGEEAAHLPTTGTTTLPGFDRFRKAYPARRRGRVKDALRFWKRDHLESQAEKIIHAVEMYIRYHKDWQKEDCKYAPDIATFLNQQRWIDLSFVPESARTTSLGGVVGEDETWKATIRELYKGFPDKVAEWTRLHFWQLPPDVQAEVQRARTLPSLVPAAS